VTSPGESGTPTQRPAKRRRAATIVDVARMAGVSQATASRALNGSDRKVKQENVSRVLEAARQLNYVPNASAQSTRRGDRSTIALIISEVTDPYFSWIAEGVIERAELEGMHVTVSVTRREASRELELIRLFRSQRSRAIIIAGSRRGSGAVASEIRHELEAYEADGGRAVDVSESGMPFDAVELGNRSGARALAQSLLGLGYLRFAVIAGPDERGAAEDRVIGFREGLAGAAIELVPSVVLRGAFSWEGGHNVASEMSAAVLEQTEVLFAVNDMMALGALAALRSRGVAVPADIALAGYDDVAPLRDIVPALTSVRIPLKQVGAQAVELGLSERGARTAVRSVEPSVQLRASTPARR
jgi:LacI family transcriptional regulator